jgi:hypothetical protein
MRTYETKGLKLFETLPTEGRQICKSCEEELPLSAFSTGERKKVWSPGTLKYRHGRCKPCMVQYVRVRKLVRKYGITMEQFQAMKDAQNYKCLLCSRVFKDRGTRFEQACIDHDHETGKVRGLLCWMCNAGLGMFDENVEALANAIKYIKGEL